MSTVRLDMEKERLLIIAGALSDELRLRILEALSRGRPMRYTEVMRELDLDPVVDSSKFAYHVGVLVEARLVDKEDDMYRLTHGGEGVLRSLRAVSSDWDRYEHQDSLKRLEGSDINKKIWATNLLWQVPFYLLNSMTIMPRSMKLAYIMMALGLFFLTLGVYWLHELRDDFSDLKLERFQASVSGMLKRNWAMPPLIMVSGQLGLLGLAILFSFLGLGNLVTGPLFFSILVSCSALLVASIYLSIRLSTLWDCIRWGEQQPDLSRGLRAGFFILSTGLLSISLTFIAYGVINSSTGRIGSGIGVLGALMGTLNGYRKYSKTETKVRSRAHVNGQRFYFD